MSVPLVDLLKLNVFDSDIEKIKHYTICTSRPDLVFKSSGLKLQVPIFSIPEDENKGNWKHENFDYQFTPLGFRDAELSEHIDIAAFGCSYTFGVGLPIYGLWHKILTKDTNLLSYNFGQPGASIAAIADIFNIVSNNVRMDKAIFLLPNYVRDLITYETVIKFKRYVELKSIIPRLHHLGLTYQDIIHEAHYKYTPDAEFVRKMKDSVYLIETMAKIKNIKVYFSSWDRPTYELLQTMDLKYAKLIEEWTWPNDKTYNEDLARDSMHPGLTHHKYWSEKIQHQVLT